MKFYFLFKGKESPYTLNQIKQALKMSLLVMLVPILIIIPSGAVSAGNSFLSVIRNHSVAEVTGKVKDDKGQGLPGASIKVKRTNAAVTTDNDGDFKLTNVEGNDILVVSFVGYLTAEIPVNNQTSIIITLKDNAQTLDETVIVGYGTQKRNQVSGAVSSINYDQTLQNRPITNIGQAIAGNASGITASQAGGQPGRDGTVLRIRGVGTLNNSDPLILIDGVVGSLTNVNPNDVASISILKDAASSAIYGSRAANGVVLVTTKRGKSGKTVINYNGYYGIQNATNLFEPVSDYATYMETMNRIQKSDNPANANLFQPSTIDAWRNATDRTLYPNTNWMEELFQQGSIAKHNLSIAGGSEKTSFYLSGAYSQNNGIMKSTDVKKYELRLNLDHQVSKKIKVGVNLAATWQDTNEPFDVSTLLNNASNATPGTTPKMVVDGEVRYGGRNTADESAEVVNPTQYTETWFYPQTRQNVFAKAYGEFQILDNLKFQANGGVDYNNNIEKQYKYGGAPTNLWNFQTMQLVQNNASLPAPMQQRNDNSLGLTFYSTLNYQPKIGEDHKLSILGGMSYEKYNSAFFLGYIQDFPSNETWELGSGLASPRVGGSSSGSSLLSYFGRADYTYKDKYILEANFRYDGSSRFAPDNRWGLFPSFSTAWRLSEEDFFKQLNIPQISNIKLRASWGRLGNQNIDLYQFLNLYSAGQNYNFGNTISAGLAPTALSNPSITWETTTSTDLGAEFGFFDNRLTLSTTWYNRKASDVLVRLPLSSLYGGLTAPFQNVGVVQNRGWEFDAGYRNNIGQLSYAFNGNLTINTNKVLKFQGDPNVIQSVANQSIIKVGESINALYGYESVGIFQNQAEIDAWAKQKPTGTNKPGDLKYRDVNGDKVIDASDRVIIGNVVPKYAYGFSAEFGYKGFNLHLMFQGVGKVSRYYQNLWYTSAIRYRRAINSDFLDAWTPQNPNTTVPRLTLETNGDNVVASSYWVQNASFLRLKDAQLAYTLPAKFFAKTFVSSVQLYANGQNLFTKTDFRGLDPETASPTQARIEYPNVRIYTFGLNVSF